MSYVLKRKIPSILKYPGGKNGELDYILSELPPQIDNFYEPFVGGGSVYFSIDCNAYFINDISTDLMNVYQCIKNEDEAFFRIMDKFNHNWKIMSLVIDNHSDELLSIYNSYKTGNLSRVDLNKAINTFVIENKDDFNGMIQPAFNIRIENFIIELQKSIVNKIVRMQVIESRKGNLSNDDLLKNIEVSFKGAFYTHFRYLYNIKDILISNSEISLGYATALYVFIRQYCYSSMFRFNKNGDFNVPYGGISYNRKTMQKNISNFKSELMQSHLKKTTIGNSDFYDFMTKYPPSTYDFIFVDPPYDTEFSTYDKNEFNQNDQIRLANYLINKCMGNFMMIIKRTDFIMSLYIEGTKTANGNSIKISSFSKKYSVSFQDRNEKNTTHMVITNY